MFAVIEFGGTEENKTAVVWRKWRSLLPKEKFSGLWPPFKISTQFNKAVVEGVTPDEARWILYPVKRCLYMTDDLLKARSAPTEESSGTTLHSMPPDVHKLEEWISVEGNEQTFSVVRNNKFTSSATDEEIQSIIQNWFQSESEVK